MSGKRGFYCLLQRRHYAHTKISEVFSQNQSDTVVIKGWVQSVRKMKEKVFMDISDGTTFKAVQVVIAKKNLPDNIGRGTSVQVEGKVTKQANGQTEVLSEIVKMIGECDLSSGYPFSAKKRYCPEYVREHINFRPRLNSFGSLLRIRDKVACAVHSFFRQNDFLCTHPPILTSNDCEGAGEVFKVIPENEDIIEAMRRKDIKQEQDEVYFNNKAYLTVSGQLHLECLARSLSKVYCFGPTFRAENSKSRLHLSEFYMVEAEVAFLSNLEEILQLMESFIKTVTKDVLDHHEEEICQYRKILELPSIDLLKKIANCKFISLQYKEVYPILSKHSDSFVHPFVDGKPLTREHELFLVHHCGEVPISVINWPSHLKPFYMKTLASPNNEVAAVDLLFPEIGELCGGGVREDDYEKLKIKLEEVNLLNKLNWYLELRKYGNALTGGFGMGFERYLQVLLGTPNIKDTIPFPRWPHNCHI